MDGQTPLQWIAIAHLLRPQGRRGELLSEPLSDLPGLFDPGRSLWLAAPQASAPLDPATATLLESSWFPTGKNAGRIVLKLAGCDSISDAEALAGQQAMVPQDQLPPLEADAFLVADLLGCLLLDGKRAVGRVIDVQFAVGPDGRTRLEDAAPLLAIEPLAIEPVPTPNALPDSPAFEAEPTGEILIPFVRAWLDSVDLPNRRITMHLPAGLAD